MKEKSCGCIIIDNEKVLLIKSKKGHWDFPKGHVEQNETEQETALREVKEETNLNVNITSDKRYINYYITDKKIDKTVIYFLAKKINGKEKPQEDEVQEVKWCTFNEALDTITFENTKNIFKNVIKDIKIKEKYSKYLQKTINIKVDRQMGSKHLKHDFIYPVNYGYVPNTVSGDGEELDAYILGVFDPIEEFKGKCIAVIHRLNDDDDKLIVAPENVDYSDDAIIALTEFQERFFKSEIIR